MTFPSSFQVDLPNWTTSLLSNLPSTIKPVEARMRLILQCARENFLQQTGGPFAAGVFNSKTGELIALGVNRVTPLMNSTLHAEIVAIALAQQKLRTYDLGATALPPHQLVVNARPCAMCFGAIPWSGIRSLVIGAPGEQVETITGFDEGPIHPNWQQQLRQRDIEVVENVLVDDAVQGFKEFMATQPEIYNGKST